MKEEKLISGGWGIPGRMSAALWEVLEDGQEARSHNLVSRHHSGDRVLAVAQCPDQHCR